jgi:hypothetical protein
MTRSGLVLDEVKRFLREEAHFAQLFTVGATGYPVGRSIGAPINDNWSVDLVQRRVHRRLRHIARNPRVELVWVGSPRPGSRNDRPAVFDYGWPVPRAVYLRGLAQPMTDEQTLAAYRRLRAPLLAAGLTRAPDRSPADVRENLAGVHVKPVRLRAEGFGEGAESFTWLAEALV